MDIARIIYRGMTKLNYSEKEVLYMTPRKFFLMFDAYLEDNGLKKADKVPSIDDLP